MTASSRTAAQALRLYSRHLQPHHQSLLHRGLATTSSNDPGPISPSIVYRRVNRGHSVLYSSLAGAQAGFWAYATYLNSQAPEPIISPTWSVAGLGLSVSFAAMVNLYLTRNVAEIAIVHGSNEKVRVVTNAMGGRLSSPILIDPKDIVPGPHKDSSTERYWTFKVRDESLHYLVDTKSGVVDPSAMAALARGGEHLAALSIRRNSTEMRERWRRWEHRKGVDKGQAKAKSDY